MKSGFLKIISDRKSQTGSGDSLGVFILLLCMTVFLSPILFFGRSLYYSDFAFITYPVKSFLAQTLQSGALPFWAPSIDSGTPFMAAFHTGVFYPPSIIFALPNPILALNLFYMLHFVILVVPVYYLARSWKLSVAAGLCSSFTALFSSFFLSSTMLSNWFLGMVWLPLIILLFQQFIVEKKALYFFAATFALICQILAASPELCDLTMLMLFAHSLVLVPREKESLSLSGRTTALATMVIFALGATALQLIPTYQLIEHSLREGGLSFEVHSYRSMAFKQLGELILPNSFDDYFSGSGPKNRIATFFISIYMGLIPFLLLIVSIRFRRQKAIRFWLWVFLVGIYKWIYSWMPLISSFRFPEKFFTISVFALVFLSGHVLDRLIVATQQREIKLHVVWVPLIFVGCLVAGVGMAQSGKSVTGALVTLFLFGVAYGLFYFGKWKPTLFYVSVLLLLGVESATQGYKVMPTVDNAFYREPPRLLAHMKNENDFFRVYTGKVGTNAFKGSTFIPIME